MTTVAKVTVWTAIWMCLATRRCWEALVAKERRKASRTSGKSTEADYEKHGYSSESLKMLESKEGQMNAVFACYGSAAQHGQLLEEALAMLITELNGMRSLESTDGGFDKKTTGQLLRMFIRDFVEEIDDWVPDFLDRARERRNFLTHEYFLKRKKAMAVEAGRLEILRELLDIEGDLRRAAGLVNGLRVAVAETRQDERGEKQRRTVIAPQRGIRSSAFDRISDEDRQLR